ncbi:MAG: hypothetical protein JJU45_05590 [Acidimicrobiia bacterium]|nr:hypothetical protein [Acidimicrobiia bacterium]
MSEPQSDDPFKADKRKDETVMLSQDNLADIVSQAKGGDAPADAPAQPASAEPAPSAAAPAPAADSDENSNSIWMLVGGIALILLLAVIAFALFG